MVGLAYFLPVLWAVLTAFKIPRDALIPSLWFTPTFDNFIQVFCRAYHPGGEVVDTQFGLYFFNSVLIAGVVSASR